MLSAAYNFHGMPRSELDKLDTKLSLIQGRLREMYADRDRLTDELQQKRLKPDMWKILESRLAILNDQIKAREKEESDIDDQRYDQLYGKHR
jgi:hypothetical protein